MLEKMKVVACPINKGKHPLHDSRYIMTEDAEVQYSPNWRDDWYLSQGSIVCKMTDIENQAKLAQAMAAAPKTKRDRDALLDACKKAAPLVSTCIDANTNAGAVYEEITQAIAQAEPK